MIYKDLPHQYDLLLIKDFVCSMPFIQVKVAGALTREQKEKIVEGITDLMQEVAHKPPSATYIVIDEVKRENWAKNRALLAPEESGD